MPKLFKNTKIYIPVISEQLKVVRMRQQPEKDI